MEVRLVDHMGSDLSVVNAARVSFAKESEWDTIPDVGPLKGYLKLGDEKLIKYLAKHNHCCLLYTSPSPRDVEESRMPSSA